MTIKIIKLQEVKNMTSLSVSSIYRLASQGRFPKPIKLAQRSSGWLEHEILDFLKERINIRGNRFSQNGEK